MKRLLFDRNRLNNFIAIFSLKLKENMKLYPEQYAKGYDETLNSLVWAINNFCFYKDTITFKETCNDLGIKCTYKAIKAYLEGLQA